ncbi:hypothetical protein PFISCL1PPCAC_25925, partial [Pristionchus fissidentatus]
AEMSKNAEVPEPLWPQSDEPKRNWFISPPLCGFQPKTMAYFHLIFMAIFCFGYSVYFRRNEQGLRGVGSPSSSVIRAQTRLVHFPTIVWIQSKDCGLLPSDLYDRLLHRIFGVLCFGVRFERRSFFIYPLIFLLGLIIVICILASLLLWNMCRVGGKSVFDCFPTLRN